MANQYEALGKPHQSTWPVGVERMNDLARQLVAEGHLPQDFSSLTQSEKPNVPEPFVLRERFTPEEKQDIEAKGGLIYLPTGLTIRAQRKAQNAKNKPSFYLTSETDRLLAVPSRQIEVAIFPAPEDFFVPGSFNQNVATQESMAAEDAKRLGLPNVTQIVPNEASTLTEVVFQHVDATGKWLLGLEYAAAQDLRDVYARTKNPTNSTGSRVTVVGYAGPELGMRVGGWWHRDRGNHRVGAVRMVVPIETK